MLGGTIVTIDGRGLPADRLAGRPDALTLALRVGATELPMEILTAESGVRAEAAGGARLVAVTNTSALRRGRGASEYELSGGDAAWPVEVVLRLGGRRAACDEDGAACAFTLGESETPVVFSVEPTIADAQAVSIITVSGVRFEPTGGVYRTPQVFWGSQPCSVLSHSAVELKCALEAATAATATLVLWSSPFGYGAPGAPTLVFFAM